VIITTGRPGGNPAGQDHGRHFRHAQVCSVLTRADACRQMALFLDDLQWADEATLGRNHQLTEIELGLLGDEDVIRMLAGNLLPGFRVSRWTRLRGRRSSSS
jgi:hypothetical protein